MGKRGDLPTFVQHCAHYMLLFFSPPSPPFSVSPHPTQSVLIGRTEDGGVRDLARIHPSPCPPPQKKTREPQPGQRFIFFLTTWEMSECRKKYQQLHMGPLLHEWPFFGPEVSPSPPFLHDKFSYALPGPPFPFSPLFSLPLRH